MHCSIRRSNSAMLVHDLDTEHKNTYNYSGLELLKCILCVLPIRTSLLQALVMAT